MFKLTTGFMRSAFSAIKPIRLIHTPRFFFANTGGSVTPQTPQKAPLYDLVESEIKYEKENSPENDQLIQILTNENWSINSKGMLHQLTKKVGDKTINIVFFSRSPAPVNEPEQGQQKEEQQQDINDFFEFTTYVRKGNGSKAMFSDFIVADGEVTMGCLNFTNDYETHKTQGKMERSQNIYQGPDLETLDENLVDSLTEYFQNLGVNQNIINFVQQYSLNAEHSFYVKWLQQLKEYV